MMSNMQTTIPASRSPQSAAWRLCAALFLAGLLPGIDGCVYRMPIQQGNYLEEATVVQVKAGMTRGQVRYLLGTPMVPGAFANDRWDYDYYIRYGKMKAPRRAHTTVYFQGDLVDHVDSDVKGAPAAVPKSPPAKSKG
jgi:outer membrane protein assembly factor BamE